MDASTRCRAVRGIGMAWPEQNGGDDAVAAAESSTKRPPITGRNVLVRQLMLHPVEPARRNHLDGILSGLPGKVLTTSCNTDEYAVEVPRDSPRALAADEHWHQLRSTDKEWFQRKNDYTEYVEARAKQSAMRGHV